MEGQIDLWMAVFLDSLRPRLWTQGGPTAVLRRGVMQGVALVPGDGWVGGSDIVSLGEMILTWPFRVC